MTDVLTVVQDPEVKRQGETLASRLEGLVAEIEAHEIHDDEDYQAALDLLEKLSRFMNRVEGVVDKPREEAYNLYQHFLDRKKQALAPGEKAEDKLRSKVEGYRERQLAQQTEKRKQIEEKAQSGDPEKVEEALQESQELDDEPTPDVEGVSYRTNWSGELEDGDTALRELCLAIGEGRAPVELVKFNSSAANKIARQRKREFDEIPGVKSVRTETLVDRR